MGLNPNILIGLDRITPGKGYLEALASPNVDVAFGSLAKVNEKGFQMEDGTSYEVDALVCATGFVSVCSSGRPVND